MSDDHNTSGIGENPEGDIHPDFLQGTQPSSSVGYDAHTSVSVWTTLGEVCGAHLYKQFRYDKDNFAWYEWRDGNHWVAIRNTVIITDVLHNDRLRIAADLGDQGRDELRDLLADDKVWRRETGGSKGEWWAGLRRSLTRPKPSPPLYQMATPSGVVDVRNGEIQPHDPLVHDTVAVTNGSYRPQEIERLKGALWNRLQHNVDVDDFEQLTEILGIAVARRSVDFWSILWLVGASGSGKSATASLIQAAFGGMAMGASAHLLLRNPQSEIDAEMAQLLQVDPFVLCVSEVERVGMSRLLSLTGGDAFGARRPHGTMQYGSLSGMIVATSVEAPAMDIDSGIPRRIAIIAFPAKLEESVNPNRFFSQDELDALITLSTHAAVHVGQKGWVPPQGNVEAKKRFLAEADPVTAWLQELPDSWHGKPFQHVLASYNREMPEPTTGTMLGKRISTSARWTRVKPKKTRLVHLVLVGRRL